MLGFNLSDAQVAKLIRFLRAGIKRQNTTQHPLRAILKLDSILMKNIVKDATGLI